MVGNGPLANFLSALHIAQALCDEILGRLELQQCILSRATNAAGKLALTVLCTDCS